MTSSENILADIRRFVVVGAGVMGGTILGAALRAGLTPDRVAVAEHRASVRDHLAATLGVTTFGEAADVVAGADVVLLAIKPQHALETVRSLAGSVAPGALVVSVVAGIGSATLEGLLPPGTPVVRVMPNTPARVGAGASAISAGSAASPDHLALVEALLSATGLVVTVEEKQLDAVTGLSGSGPAYVLLIIEALADAGVRLGLTRDVAQRLAVQTVGGTARLAAETGEHPALLREAVTSPGGTTAAGLAALEEGAVRAAVAAAVVASAERSATIGG